MRVREDGAGAGARDKAYGEPLSPRVSACASSRGVCGGPRFMG